MKRALIEYQISGVITNIPAFNWVLKQKKFLDGSFDINFLDTDFLPLVPGKWKEDSANEIEEIAAIMGALLKLKNISTTTQKNKIPETNQWLNQNYE
jgi:pyruvate carboxylase